MLPWQTGMVCQNAFMPEWRNGRRAWLKPRYPRGCVGPNPTLGTKLDFYKKILYNIYVRIEKGNKKLWIIGIALLVKFNLMKIG